MTLTRRAAAAIIAALAATAATALVVAIATAAPAFKMPFPCGETWRATTFRGHQPSENAVDWNRPDDNRAIVLAGVAGVARVPTPRPRGYGNYVDIDAGGGWSTRYAHLSEVSIRTGDRVGPRDQIGLVGSTGNSTGPHLHYEQRLNGVPQHVAFDGVAIRVGASHTSTNCDAEPTPTPDPTPTPEPDQGTTEARLEALERAVADLERRVDALTADQQGEQ